jgi:2-polyprenyl-6-methoxyphenol hydroxylase-like FAD-dependent oxidoreductase
MSVISEEVDVAVVGARLGGCAVAAPLARAGRRVVVIDRMGFPSDQLSTHILMPAGVSEIARIGALPRILEQCEPSPVRYVQLEAEGVHAVDRVRPAEDGIDYGFCIPRDLQDVCLVEAVREQGGDVREHCTFQALRWRAGRVDGLRYVDGEGRPHELRAKLVVGADGRRSPVAAAAGASRPYRMSRNGRGLVFRYLDDPQHGTGSRDVESYFQWRNGDSFAFAFPTSPRGRMLVLFMGAREEVSEARRDGEAYWQRKLQEHRGLRARVAGADWSTATKLRTTADTTAFFRASSGPGWALVGDAAHFKDPVTGQGMRDAMWMGRTLAEHVLPHLEDPLAIDRASRTWERQRDEHCLPAYHFANADTRIETQSPTICELVREAGRTEDSGLSDLFGRGRTLQEIAPLPRLAKVTAKALVHGERPRSETIRRAVPELLTELAIRRERLRGAFRDARLVVGSDHPDPELPKVPPVMTVQALDAPPVRPAEPPAVPAPVRPVPEEVAA